MRLAPKPVYIKTNWESNFHYFDIVLWMRSAFDNAGMSHFNQDDLGLEVFAFVASRLSGHIYDDIILSVKCG